jgi:membrane protease YdiL (CAAX protease family)
VRRLLPCQGMPSAPASAPLASSTNFARSAPAPIAEPVDGLRRVVAWSAMIIASALPVILSRLSGQTATASLPLAQTVVLVITALLIYRSGRLRPLIGFLLTLAILRLGWFGVAPVLANWAPIQNLSAHSSWAAQQLIARSLNCVGVILLLATLAGRNFTRGDLFLRVGALDAAAQPERILWFRKPIPWTRLGPQLLFVFGIALPLFLFITIRPDIGHLSRLWPILPWALATAAVNAANEEFQFRCVPLAHLHGVLLSREAMLLTSVFFGVAHYFGQPSGPIGVIMAAIAGWIWAKSMVETRGAGWAFGIHMAQDVVIFCFLALAVKS